MKIFRTDLQGTSIESGHLSIYLLKFISFFVCSGSIFLLRNSLTESANGAPVVVFAPPPPLPNWFPSFQLIRRTQHGARPASRSVLLTTIKWTPSRDLWDRPVGDEHALFRATVPMAQGQKCGKSKTHQNKQFAYKKIIANL